MDLKYKEGVWSLTFLYATATAFGTRSIVVVPIEPEEEDEYADLPIYERIQWLLYDLWIIQNYLSLRQ